MAEREPTAEQIEAMTARGWKWYAAGLMFAAQGGLNRDGCPIISLRVLAWDGPSWVADYGTPGISCSPWKRSATPEEAADEAETWLRRTLAPFRLPWLANPLSPKRDAELEPTAGRLRHEPDPFASEKESWVKCAHCAAAFRRDTDRECPARLRDALDASGAAREKAAGSFATVLVRSEAENTALLARIERLTDLVRHQRGALHDAELIDDDEYAALAAEHGAPARLVGYDLVRADLLDEREQHRITLDTLRAWQASLSALSGLDDPHSCLDDVREALLAGRQALITRAETAEGEVAKLLVLLGRRDRSDAFIFRVKAYREATGCGLVEAKNRVAELTGIEDINGEGAKK